MVADLVCAARVDHSPPGGPAGTTIYIAPLRTNEEIYQARGATTGAHSQRSTVTRSGRGGPPASGMGGGFSRAGAGTPLRRTYSTRWPLRRADRCRRQLAGGARRVSKSGVLFQPRRTRCSSRFLLPDGGKRRGNRASDRAAGAKSGQKSHDGIVGQGMGTEISLDRRPGLRWGGPFLPTSPAAICWAGRAARLA